MGGLRTETTTDAVLAKCVAKALGAGCFASSATFHVSAAIWWAKYKGGGTCEDPVTEAGPHAAQEGVGDR